MIKRIEYNIVISKNMTHPKGNVVREMLEKKENKEEALPVKILIGKEKMTGKWPVYLEEEARENLCGNIDSIENSEGPMDDIDIEAFAGNGSYELRLNGINEKGRFTGTFTAIIDETAHKTVDEGTQLSERIEKLCEKIINDELADKKDLTERVKFMQKNFVDEPLMYRVLSGYRQYNKPSHTPSCIYQDPYLDEKRSKKMEGIISEGLRAAVGRQAIICEGEKSVGKNVYLETVAWLMNMPMYLITFSRYMSPGAIYGEKTTDNSAAQALADFDSNILVKAEAVEEKRKFIMNICAKQGVASSDIESVIQGNLSDEDKHIMAEAARFRMLQAQSSSVNIIIDQSELYDWLADGGIMVFNEMNMAEANFFASFTNQLLDGTGFLFIPGRGEVPINKDCVLFGTQNADYQGVESQNEATMSRFGCIDFPQPKSIKKQLVAATEAAIRRGSNPEAKLEMKYYTECEKFYSQCRNAVQKGIKNNGGVSVVSNACLNIRGFVRALTAVAESEGYASLKRQVEIHVINTCPSDDRAALVPIMEQLITL